MLYVFVPSYLILLPTMEPFDCKSMCLPNILVAATVPSLSLPLPPPQSVYRISSGGLPALLDILSVGRVDVTGG